MPFTPYHFGPSGFIGLVFKKWIDVPVFVLANVIVDMEVAAMYLLGPGRPCHRYFHTFLIGAAVGAIWGIAAYPLRRIFEKIMQVFRIPYQTDLKKMIISGILGVWLHVFIDAFQHWDMKPFWPSKIRPLYGLAGEETIKMVCIAFFVAAFIAYAIIAQLHLKKTAPKK